MVLPAAHPPRRLAPTRTPVPKPDAPRRAPRPAPRRPHLPDPVPMPPLPAPPSRAKAHQQEALPPAPPAAAPALEALVSPRTLQVRFDLDDDELTELRAQLTPVRVGAMTRYRLADVTALLGDAA